MQNKGIPGCTAIALIALISILLFSELSGVCVFDFREQICQVTDCKAVFNHVPHFDYFVDLEYSDKSLCGLANTTCYVMSSWIGPSIELNMHGVVFGTCGPFTILTIVLYVVIMLIFTYITVTMIFSRSS